MLYYSFPYFTSLFSSVYMLFENLHIHMFLFELEVEKEWSCYSLAYFVGNFPSLIQNLF